MTRIRVILCALALAAAGPVSAQIQQGTIQGALVGPDGQPVATAVVTLVDSLGDPIQTATATAGRFRLTNVAPGTYGLRAETPCPAPCQVPPLRGALTDLRVRAAVPVDVSIRLSAVAAEQVVVRADAGDLGSTTAVTISGDALRRAPARIRGRALQDAVASTPGWTSEDNGLLHVRGVDDGLLYVIDGVPVYERLDGLFGVAPDPSMVESVTVITGYIAPEFGFKSGGVIEVRSAASGMDGWAASLEAAGASDDGREAAALAGGALSETMSLTLGASTLASSRFLDPVHPDNLHNDGRSVTGGAQFGWVIAPASTLSAVAGFGASDFDVPHLEEQEDAGQDQTQALRNSWQTASWQRAWASDTVSQIAGYHRFGTSALIGSERDLPLHVDAERSLRRVGVLGSVTYERGRHLVKAGTEASRLWLREAFSFAVTDAEAAEEANISERAAGFDLAHPFRFDEAAAAALASVYVQDTIRVTPAFTVDLGVRVDWSRLLTSAAQVSPRLGAAYYLPASDTRLRASFGRFFQPPQPEHLLLASSAEARALSPFEEQNGGGGALEPERQTGVEVGVSQSLARRLRLDVSYWHRRIRHAGDPNVFFGTTIIFPNVVDRGRASGVDVRLEMPRRDGWSGYVSYANAHIAQFGPITGGLFLEDEVIEIGPGTRFTPDHDQRHVGAFGASYDHAAAGFAGSFTGRYESGTPLEVEEDELDELDERPGAELVDFERGRVKPRLLFDLVASQRLYRGGRADVEVRAAVLNLFDEPFAYNFGNPFSGTHFGAGRTVQAGVRVSFR